MNIKPSSLWVIVKRSYGIRAAEPIPVITVPKYLEASLKQQEGKTKLRIGEIARTRASQGNRRVPVVSCKKNPLLNHYYGQSYPKDRRGVSVIPLASAGWKRAKYRNDEITFRAYANNRNLSEKETFSEERVDFNGLRLPQVVSDAISSFGYKEPTEIQLRAIPTILSGSNVSLSAETGTGKTLAYLAPIISSILKQKQSGGDVEARRAPKALIVVPGRELAEQVGKTALKMGSFCGVGVATMIGGAPKYIAHSGYDILVTTIGLIHEHLKRGIYTLKDVKQLVLDEADTLLDDSFSFNVLDLLRSLRFKDSSSNQGVQLIMVSATYPREMARILGDYIDTEALEVIQTKNLHFLHPHVKQTFLRLHKYDRDAALLKLVTADVENHKPVIIFSNRTPASNWISLFLNKNGIDCSRLNKSLSDVERLETFDRFQTGDCDVLSCTDLASRGLDTIRARHIINFDCPHHVADYIHRAGRTGRIGSKNSSEVTTFVSFTQDVLMLQELEKSMRTGRPVDNVNANIKKVLRDNNDFRKSRIAARRKEAPMAEDEERACRKKTL